jgi:hypothetical protein
MDDSKGNKDEEGRWEKRAALFGWAFGGQENFGPSGACSSEG